ncbi:MAG: ABC transporter ATP-binding protein [Gammaproteobacteria bacterium]|nr:ABC transporter ATP-binding protein [Gammaproteobacteria bacterium]
MSLLSCNKLEIKIAEKLICQELSLRINAGENWAILGMNGCGKTTLLHSLAGLLPSQAGDILINDLNLSQLSRRQVAQQVSLLLQHQEDYFPGTVLEAVLIGRHPHIKSWQWESDNDKQLVLEALQLVGLDDFADRAILTLSGGERQRVALATLLVQQTPIRLLDEPVNHLDIHHQHEVMKLLSGNSNDIANVFVLHDVNLAARYCDHALLMPGNGETIQGACSEVLTPGNLSTLYQHPIKEILHQDQRLFIADSH